MAEDRNDPLADLFTLFAAPLSGTVRSLDQFRKGVDEFLKGVENFNRTMANLNETTERINSLLADVEEPIRAAIPQVTRTVKVADEMMQVVSGPAMAVAPALNRLADTLSTPAFTQLPSQIGQFSDLLAEVSHRLSPLTQLAESAGGLFGGFRVPGTRGSTRSPIAAHDHHRNQGDPHADSAGQEGCSQRRLAKKAPAKKALRRRRPPRSVQREEGLTEEGCTEVLSRRSSWPRSGQRVTKGVSTTVPDTGLPRTSMTTAVPSSVCGGRKANAMPWPSTGE